MGCARTTRTVRAARWIAVLAWCAGVTPAGADPGPTRCPATITGSFADSCRDFAAHSNRYISYVDLHYLDGRVIRHRNINSRHFSIDGLPGDELGFTKVKSGTTLQEFQCQAANQAPTARLEIQSPPVDEATGHCYHFINDLICEQSTPRTAWAGTAQLTRVGDELGPFVWGCGGVSPPSQCLWTIRFRGTGSSDPDGDIASWSLDFGDGTSMSGTWSAPPAEVDHAYAPDGTSCVGVNGSNGVCVLTLTVTDSSGQSASETIRMVFLEQSPD